MLRPLLAALAGAAFPVALAAPLASGTDPPPLCRVDRSAVPGAIPGTYTVTLRTVPDCPPNGYARVRLESGRIYPWRTVTPDRPARYRGIPWWWMGAWESASGRIYRFKIPGMRAPWEA